MTTKNALRERAGLLDELRQIVQAMKNIAFAELQRVSRMRPAQRQALEAVAQALHAMPGTPSAPLGAAATVWFVIGAERGFCGAFSARLAQGIEDLRREMPQARVLVAGRRVVDLLGADASGVVSVAGCAAIDDADAALDAWMSALDGELKLRHAVQLLHADGAELMRRPLWPVPDVPAVLPGGLPRDPLEAQSGLFAHVEPSPWHYLPVHDMRAALQRQAMRLLLQQGLAASLEQENHWRLTQMQRAQDHLDELGNTLRQRHARLRQADITNELETLMSSLQGDPAAASSAAS